MDTTQAGGNGITNGNPPNFRFNFGGTPNCTKGFIYPKVGTTPDCVTNPYIGYTKQKDTFFGMDPIHNPPGIVMIPFSITPRPAWQACKESANPVSCGAPYDPITLRASIWWPWSGSSPPSYKNSPYWSYLWSPTDSDVAGAACPTDQMVCPAPPKDTCSIGVCPDRCNKFTILKVKTVSGQTTVRVNVTNQCADPFYYAAFGVDTRGTSASVAFVNPPAAGATFQGTNYAWSISYINGANANTQTTPPINWIRFVSKGTNGQYPQFSNTSVSNKNWDVFEFNITGWDLGLPFTVQGHQGGKWDTFTSVDASTCLCTDCDTTTNNGCPDGFTGTNCTQCDKNPLPGGYTWFCVNTTRPTQPWELHKIPNRLLNTGSWTVPPGFIPSAGNGLLVDKDGYLVNCDCNRIIYDCSPLNFCNGHGKCVPQDGTCICDTGYLGPDCRPPTTTPAVTTTPAGTTTTPAPTTTVPGQTFTTPPPTTTPPGTNPPCFNNARFCSGHGSCVNDKCSCDAAYEGADCSVVIVTTPQHYCSEFTTCDNCSAQAAQYSLQCTWCNDIIGGGCVATTTCQAAGTCNGGAVSFVAEPCPDDCSGTKHGVCVNQTCSDLAAAGVKVQKVNGVLACIDDSNLENQTDTTNNETAKANNAGAISFCLCNKGYKGNNCGSKSSGLGKALAISGGVIAAIVICGVIVLVIVAFGAKKGVDFVMLNQQAASHFKNNPLEETRNKEYTNAMHS